MGNLRTFVNYVSSYGIVTLDLMAFVCLFLFLTCYFLMNLTDFTCLPGITCFLMLSNFLLEDLTFYSTFVEKYFDMTTLYYSHIKDQLKFCLFCEVIHVYLVKIILSQPWTSVPIYNTSPTVLIHWILYYSYYMHVTYHSRQ